MSGNSAQESIAAIATPPGEGGIGIVRVSGPQALACARRLSSVEPQIGKVLYARFQDEQGEAVDEGLLLSFAAPASFTGEDVVEFQIHGGRYVLARMLQAACRCDGIRPARAGEFSERAFHNGKLDLVQAEAIADLISANSEAASRAAQRSLSGEFSRRCHQLHEGMLDLRMRLESAIDFPEEEIDFLSDPELKERWKTLHVEHSRLLHGARQGVQLNQGITVVLAGAPNAGKSSLLNALSQKDSAIVTDIPGTTRDILREQLSLNGVPVSLIDTAGLRDSRDPVEQEGIRRAREAVMHADFLLLVRAPGCEAIAPPVTQAHVIEIHNKADLDQLPAAWLDDAHSQIRLSAKTGDGLDLLIAELSGRQHSSEGEFSARERHVDALLNCGEHLQRAGQQLDDGAGDLCAEELRLAQQALGEITGQVHSDDLLGRIFSSFCIGK